MPDQSNSQSENHEDEVSTTIPSQNITITQRVNKVIGGKVIGAIINLPDPDAERLREARTILCRRVKSYWIEEAGVERNRQGALQAIESDHRRFIAEGGLLQLHKQYLPEAVDFSSQAANIVAHLHTDDSEEQNTIAPERAIEEIFDEEEHSLLILGAPGVGKSVTLLQLARAAMQRIELDPESTEHPIPLILNLAAWANEQQPIGDWVLQELSTVQYGIPKDVAQVWLRNYDLLLLLDGLNELSHEVRRRCVIQLNTFIEQQGTMQLAVCCRTEEYTTLPIKLKLRQAIQLDPLTDEQLADYFGAAGESLANLREALQQDVVLHELATTPLMLHIMSIAYADVERTDISMQRTQSVEEQRHHLFTLYVTRMLRYGGADKPFDDRAMTGWLSWLAQQMFAHNRPVFLIEQLQPSWLPSVTWQWLYMFGSRMSIGLLAGLIGGVVIGMGLGPIDGYGHAFRRGITEGPLTGLISGAIIALVDMLWIRIIGPYLATRHISQLWQSFLKITLVTLNVSAFVAALFALLLGSTNFLGWPMWAWWAEGQQVGFLSGLSASLLFAFGPQAIRYSLRQDIQTVERVSWSRARAWRNGVVALLVGTLAGAIATFLPSANTPMIRAMTDRGIGPMGVIIIMTLMGAGMLGLMGVVFGGFTGTFRKIQKVTPNQGLRLSLLNAGLVALIIGGIFSPLTALLGWLVSGGAIAYTISYAFYGLFVGVLAAMWYGLLFALQHGVLRLLLWRTGHTPRVGQYARLLDQAARHIFLQKVGGGYKFVNRYVQEYFAELTRPSGIDMHE